MLSSILGAIAAIPALISAIQELLAYFKKAEDAGWLDKSNAVFKSLSQPTTPEEKAADAKAFSLVSCANGPKLNVCISDPKNNQLSCFDSRTQAASTIPYSKTENYFCLSPQDAQTLLNYYKAKP